MSVLADLPRDIGIFVRVHPDVPVGFALAAVQSTRDAGFEQVTYVPEGDRLKTCRHVLVSVVLLAVCLIDTVSRGDDVALWLESRGFNRLLIEHLESKLPTLDGEEQADEAMRLARLYAGLLLNPRDERIARGKFEEANCSRTFHRARLMICGSSCSTAGI